MILYMFKICLYVETPAACLFTSSFRSLCILTMPGATGNSKFDMSECLQETLAFFVDSVLCRLQNILSHLSFKCMKHFSNKIFLT